MVSVKNNKSYPSKEARQLFKAILSLRTDKEASDFFRDLLTLPEIEDISQRFQIAKLLSQGGSYSTVAEKIKASTTTVTRVAHWLHRGRGGYKLILKRLKLSKQK